MPIADDLYCLCLFQALEAQRAAFEAELAKQRADLSDEQLKMLLAEHDQQREFLDRNMDAEKNRQTRSLADKIAEKRRKRAAAMEKKHVAQNAVELAEESRERNELLGEQGRFDWGIDFRY